MGVDGEIMNPKIKEAIIGIGCAVLVGLNIWSGCFILGYGTAGFNFGIVGFMFYSKLIEMEMK